uniref:Uncharacterized protein n=1 Tax=Opuntia streptacantha TaxID=393608 RepID=A0A7C9A5D3_OPUST
MTSPIPRDVLTTDSAKPRCSSLQISEAYALMVPSKLLKQPRINLTESAIQKFELRPKRVLKINTESVPINMMGLRPYLSAAIPQRIDVKALPTINEEPINPA